MQHASVCLCAVRPLVLTDQIDRKTPYVYQYEAIVERQLSTPPRWRSAISERKVTSCNGGSTWRTSRCLVRRLPPSARHFRSSVSSRVPPMSATSDYNSLGVKLTRRYAAGLTVLGSYTFSKSTDNAAASGRLAQTH